MGEGGLERDLRSAGVAALSELSLVRRTTTAIAVTVEVAVTAPHDVTDVNYPSLPPWVIEIPCAVSTPHRASEFHEPSGSDWVTEAPRGFLGMGGRLLLARRGGRVCV